MCGLPRDQGPRFEEARVPLVDLTAFSQRSGRTPVHTGEQRCHAGQLVSRNQVNCQLRSELQSYLRVDIAI